MQIVTSWLKLHRTFGVAATLAIVCCALAFGGSVSTVTIASTKTNSFGQTPQVSIQCTASAVFSASFTQNQQPSPELKQHWRDFTDSLVPSDYNTVAISGTNDSVGRTLIDATIVPQIATAIKKGTPGSWTSGAVTWNVSHSCDGD